MFCNDVCVHEYTHTQWYDTTDLGKIKPHQNLLSLMQYQNNLLRK